MTWKTNVDVGFILLRSGFVWDAQDVLGFWIASFEQDKELDFAFACMHMVNNSYLVHGKLKVWFLDNMIRSMTGHRGIVWQNALKRMMEFDTGEVLPLLDCAVRQVFDDIVMTKEQRLELIQAQRICLIPSNAYASLMQEWGQAAGLESTGVRKLATSEKIVKLTACLVECARLSFAQQFSWSIPSNEALEFLQSLPVDLIIDIGAGNGYWGSKLPGKISCVEIRGMVNEYTCVSSKPFCDIQTFQNPQEITDMIVQMSKRSNVALLFGWIPVDKSDLFAQYYIKPFPGTHIIIIDDRNISHARGVHVNRALSECNFKEARSLPLPSFPDRQDYLTLYNNKRNILK